VTSKIGPLERAGQDCGLQCAVELQQVSRRLLPAAGNNGEPGNPEKCRAGDKLPMMADSGLVNFLH